MTKKLRKPKDHESGLLAAKGLYFQRQERENTCFQTWLVFVPFLVFFTTNFFSRTPQVTYKLLNKTTMD